MTGPAVTALTREQAEPAVSAAAAQRDTIQANLLDLDASFGKRLLAGASLDGETRRRWDTAAATLARLFETFTVYSAVVDQAAELLPRARKSAAALADLAVLLTGASVQLPTATSALASRDLTRTGTAAVTLAAAVGEMRRGFAGVAELVTTVERVWNELAGPVQDLADQLAAARQQAGGIADAMLDEAAGPAEAGLAELRGLLNRNPLALVSPVGGSGGAGGHGAAGPAAPAGVRGHRPGRRAGRAAGRRGHPDRRGRGGRGRRPGRLAGRDGRPGQSRSQDRGRPAAAARGRRAGRPGGRPGRAARRRAVEPAGHRAGRRWTSWPAGLIDAVPGGGTRRPRPAGPAGRAARPARRLPGPGGPARRGGGRRPGGAVQPGPGAALDGALRPALGHRRGDRVPAGRPSARRAQEATMSALADRRWGQTMQPLRPGDPRQVGPYRIRARLGAGGMGQVFLGYSPGGRAVAVKVIHRELAQDPAFRTRFRREVAAARAVSGAYTAPVTAAGPDDDPPWLATVFVPGPSLAAAVAEAGPLPAAAVWKLAAGLVEALQAVHSGGLVHRDLKPGNVLLAIDGPRLIDFGIARALERTAVTSTGQIVGTPSFMSPEQVEGGRAGPATDVFSLGCVIVFAATGTGAFGDGPPASMLYRVVHAPPTLAGLPGGLRELAAACLAKQPADRLAAGRAGRGDRRRPGVGAGHRAGLVLAGAGDRADPVLPGQADRRHAGHTGHRGRSRTNRRWWPTATWNSPIALRAGGGSAG